ncbi:MAG: hypothetical protein ACR2FU_13335 [Streptosporangiaceae bacterium]
MTAVSARDIWAVGSYVPAGTGVPYQHRTLTEHWNGSSWSIVPFPDPGGHRLRSISPLSSVAAVSADDVWAVGTYTRPGQPRRTLIARWNGSTWTQVPSVSPAGRPGVVELPSPSKPQSGRYSYLAAVAALAGGPVLAVGAWECKDGFAPIAERRTPAGWRLSPTPHGGYNLCSA